MNSHQTIPQTLVRLCRQSWAELGRVGQRNPCELCQLTHSQREHEPDTFAWHKGYLQKFCDRYGRMQASDLIPFHLTAWLDAYPGWKAARRHATVVVKRAFAWARRQGLITALS